MLTLIDSLDSLLLFQEYDLFFDALKKLKKVTFNRNLEVSVFEVNIRILGGLLSAHQLACKLFNIDNNYKRKTDLKILERSEIFIADNNDYSNSKNIDNDMIRNRNYNDNNDILKNRNNNDNNTARNINIFYNSNHGRHDDKNIENEYENEDENIFSKNERNKNKYDYDGIFLLNLAIDIADRLMPAFQTMTGVPVHKINLMYGLDSFSNSVNNDDNMNSNYNSNESNRNDNNNFDSNNNNNNNNNNNSNDNNNNDDNNNQIHENDKSTDNNKIKNNDTDSKDNYNICSNCGNVNLDKTSFKSDLRNKIENDKRRNKIIENREIKKQWRKKLKREKKSREEEEKRAKNRLQFTCTAAGSSFLLEMALLSKLSGK